MAENQNDQTDIEPLSDEALEEVAGGLAASSSDHCCSCSQCSVTPPSQPAEPAPSGPIWA